MRSQGSDGSEDQAGAEAKSGVDQNEHPPTPLRPLVAGELELCSELHEGDPGWTTIPEETQDTEQEGEYTPYQYESDAVEYPILLWTVLVFGLSFALGRCTVRR